jgi:hypothetical protein
VAASLLDEAECLAMHDFSYIGPNMGIFNPHGHTHDRYSVIICSSQSRVWCPSEINAASERVGEGPIDLEQKALRLYYLII